MKHPASFSPQILKAISIEIKRHQRKYPGETLKLLDPFAGIGKIHLLAGPYLLTWGIEIEPEWAGAHRFTQVGDARDLPFPANTFDFVATSPTYGNRMADHHEAQDSSRRITYRHLLGRPLTEGNSGAMQWGPEYRLLHTEAWKEVRRVLQKEGLFLLNLKNHIRKGKEIEVAEWHIGVLQDLGFRLQKEVKVPTKGMRFGSNSNQRIDGERLFVLSS